MRWNELPPGSDFVEVIAQLTTLEARALQKIGNAKFSAPFTNETRRSLHERLIHHGAHEIAVVQPLRRRLHHENGNQFLLRIDPEVGAGDTAPGKITDRTRQWIAAAVRANREAEAETEPKLRHRRPRAEQDRS
jgi:hypothetical protein